MIFLFFDFLFDNCFFNLFGVFFFMFSFFSSFFLYRVSRQKQKLKIPSMLVISGRNHFLNAIAFLQCIRVKNSYNLIMIYMTVITRYNKQNNLLYLQLFPLLFQSNSLFFLIFFSLYRYFFCFYSCYVFSPYNLQIYLLYLWVKVLLEPFA